MDRRARALSDLATLVELRTVSSDPRCAGLLGRAAGWLAGRLRAAGLPVVGVLRAGGPPVVLGTTVSRVSGQRGRPHVLLYAHYDVQPAGDGWRRPPFRLTRTRDGLLHGRGTADDKGPLVALVLAVEDILRQRVPVDVTVLLDGEEEIGSPHLGAALRRLAAAGGRAPDVAVVCDTRMPAVDRPAVVRSFRGSAMLDLTVRSPGGARHAGAYGGAVPDPAAELCRLVGSLHDEEGLLAPSGLRRPAHGRRPDAAVRRSLLPAAVVTALSAGTGAVAVPGTATARLNVRSAPGQDTRAVVRALADHLLVRSSPGLAVGLASGPVVQPVEALHDGPWLAAVRAACVAGHGRPPVLLRSGGTIAAVGLLQEVLRVSVVALGVVPPGCRVHTTDERWPEVLLGRTARTIAAFLTEVAGTSVSRDRGPVPSTPGRRRAAAR